MISIAQNLRLMTPSRHGRPDASNGRGIVPILYNRVGQWNKTDPQPESCDYKCTATTGLILHVIRN